MMKTLYDAHFPNAENRRPGRNPDCPDADIIAIRGLLEHIGADSEHSGYQRLKVELKTVFPSLPERSRFNRRRQSNPADSTPILTPMPIPKKKSLRSTEPSGFNFLSRRAAASACFRAQRFDFSCAFSIFSGRRVRPCIVGILCLTASGCSSPATSQLLKPRRDRTDTTDTRLVILANIHCNAFPLNVCRDPRGNHPTF